MTERRCDLRLSAEPTVGDSELKRSFLRSIADVPELLPGQRASIEVYEGGQTRWSLSVFVTELEANGKYEG
jgi:hypothetical protein